MKRLAILFLIVGLVLLLRHFVLFPLLSKSKAMKPEIQPKSLLIFSPLIQPALGKIALIHSPLATTPLICRIQALPQSNPIYVQSEGKNLIINQRLMPHPTQNAHSTMVAPGEFYCLFDNAEIAGDSRALGPIPREKIQAILLFHF